MVKDKNGHSIVENNTVYVSLIDKEGIVLSIAQDFRDGTERAVVFFGEENSVYIIDPDDLEYVGPVYDLRESDDDDDESSGDA